MDFEWVAIALGDVVWISLAFAFGLAARGIGLPPLVGFLLAGFLLGSQGIASGEMLQKLADLGVTLLLFTVGLKLRLHTLSRLHVWGTTVVHTTLVTVVLGAMIAALAGLGLPLFAGVGVSEAVLLAFALSFSSTVFVVKLLEERGEMNSLHGQIALGILIVQDLAAVAFLAGSTGYWPSPWALAILVLIPLRPLLGKLLEFVGHGELLVLYGLLLALGGAEVFELVGLKGDLGALVIGILVAPHKKADELARTMLGFKDLFLLGFFLSIGLSGVLTLSAVMTGLLLTPLIVLKSALFFALLIRFHLRSRTALLSALNLMNFSEFGLIVASVGVANQWLGAEWLTVLAVAASFSFALSAVINGFGHRLYATYRPRWQRLQHRQRIPEDRLIDVSWASVAVVGMGRVGSGAYDTLARRYGDMIIGVEIDPEGVASHTELGRNVVHGDPSDPDFWDRVQATHSLELILLALPKASIGIAVLEQLRAVAFDGKVASIARFPDEVDELKAAGADTVFNIYAEAGTGFALHVAEQSRSAAAAGAATRMPDG